MELTIHTGTAGDYHKINIDWFDENNIRQKTTLELKIRDQDKPRVLEIYINQLCFSVLKLQY